MDTFTLHTNTQASTTSVSNIFIDTYMPAANGSYVKVYLYLLRCLSSASPNLSISLIADHLENTEKDVLRALAYWEKVHLISTAKNTTGTITSISLNEPQTVSPISEQNTPKTSPVAATEYAAHSNAQVEAVIPTAPKFERPSYTATQISELTNNDEIQWLLNIIEIYMERPLKPGDVQLILFLYETVHFSVDLIMYLYEYCISKNKKNIAYIEAVALSWAEDGIDSVEKAEESAIKYNSNYSAVMKAFGLQRAPGNIERRYMNTWVDQYGFDNNIIIEACNRTILRTGKPDFKYAHKILESWHKSGVKKFADISVNDAQHSKTTAKASTLNTKTTGNSKNKFNAFPQRNYSQEDYSSMEKRLLEKSLKNGKE